VLRAVGIFVCIVLGGLGLAAPAAAAPRWFPATQISGDSGAQPDVEFTSRGEAIAVWGGKFDDWEGPAQAGFRQPGSAFGPPQDLEPGGHPELAVRPNGVAAAVMYGGPPDYGLKTTVRKPGERFGATVRLPVTGLVSGPDVGVDDDGTTITVYYEADYAAQTARLWAIRRAPDGSFGPAEFIAEHGTIYAPRVHVGPDGSATVLWNAFEHGENAGATVTRVATAQRGGNFGAPHLLEGPAYPDTAQLALTGNARGDTLAVWKGAEVRTAIRPAGGEWGPAERIPPAGVGNPHVLELSAAVSPTGEAMATWSDGYRVFFSVRPPDGEWRRADTITSYPVCCELPAPGDQRAPGVAYDQAGNLHLLFEGEPERNFKQGIWATVREAGDDAFGTLQLVRAGKDLETPDVAVDPDGNAAAVWSEKERPGERDFGAERVYGALYDLAPPVVEQYVETGQYLEASGGRFRFRLSEAARVTIEIRQGRRRIGTVTGRGLRGRGSARVPARLARRLARPGAYRATVVARDAAGRRSKARTARFRRLLR
jgi:hypothetical protein